VIPATDWEQLAGTVVQRLGRDPQGNFSPQRFTTAYGNMSDQGKAILFNKLPGGDLRQSLDDISTISQRIQQVGRFANPSGTAQVTAGLGEMAGLIHDPLSTLATIAGGRVMAHALARPATAASTARWTSAYGRFLASPGPPTLVALGQASKNLAATYNDQLGANVDPDAIVNAATQGKRQ
jgi:hypothetical protein